MEPEVFLLDEPTADIDPAATHPVIRRLRQIWESGRCVVVVPHAIVLARRCADRVGLLAAGRITAELPAGEAVPAARSALGLRYGFDPEPRLLPSA